MDGNGQIPELHSVIRAPEAGADEEAAAARLLPALRALVAEESAAVLAEAAEEIQRRVERRLPELLASLAESRRD
ncbi:hypothetical protein QVG61_10800 [Thiohalobacter sp. IOR34]|uniref:hypothetical protein n=1 Tax=Thiohalobacter sp. IOR34 TaxID=3057176 RepID=UPI0025AF8D89|nr:hypothetical protein [Thiohalobacter sp. IOR34]WJW74982.1 hypothetical protein QVG61_10800 [Thiohalobacter sp. IOR34]